MGGGVSALPVKVESMMVAVAMSAMNNLFFIMVESYHCLDICQAVILQFCRGR